MACLPDEHRFEYLTIKDGIEWEICANPNCGETKFRYHDVGSGG